jgi:hypothetical protein
MEKLVAAGFGLLATALVMLGVSPKIAAWWVSYKNQSITDTALFTYHQLQPVFAQRGGFGTASISAATVDQYNAVPKRMVQNNGGTKTLTNDFSGSQAHSGAGQRLNVDNDNIPATNCRALAVGFGTDSGFYAFSVASAIGGLGSATLQTASVDDTTANTLCSGTTNAVRLVVGP